MRVLITSGGCSEPVDEVRSISNFATGRLGSLIADAFIAAGAEVTYLCGLGALLPGGPATIHRVRGVQQLGATLDHLLVADAYDCIVHAMAVSDYTVRGTTSTGALAHHLAEGLKNTPAGSLEATLLGLLGSAPLTGTNGKLASDTPAPLILLAKAPKVIAGIKARQPGAILVGFKLLAGVGEERLVEAASALLQKNSCDLVLANDIEDIHGDAHKALLLSPSGVTARYTTKQEIAAGIVKNATALWRERP